MPRTDAVFVMPDLKGPDGNAFVLLAQARMRLRDAGVPKDDQEWFYKQATSGDYETLLATILEWFHVAVPKTEYVLINGDGQLSETTDS